MFIVQDLTKLQREEEDELFNAAKAKNISMTEEEKKTSSGRLEEKERGDW